MKKKLLILAAPFDYYQGGSEYQYKILERHLKERYQVSYLFRHPTKPLEAHYVTYDYLLRNRYREYLFTDALVIYRKLRQLSPDVIYKRGINYITAIGILYATRNKCESVLHIASQRDLDATLSGASRNSVREAFHSGIARYSIQHADRVVCQAEDQAVLLERNFGRHCDLVLPNIHPVPDDDPWVKKDPITVVWVGNIKPLKRPEILLDLAAAFVGEQHVRFLMIGREGSGKHYADFVSRLTHAPNVAYLGELPVEQVNRILGESHILVNTSDFEGFPNTFIQAWMREVPVVSLNVDPDRLLVNDGLGFCSGSIGRLKHDVGELVRNNGLREEIGRRARSLANQKFGDVNGQVFEQALLRWTA